MRAWSHLSFGVALALVVGCFPPALPRPDADVTDDTNETNETVDTDDITEVDTPGDAEGRVAAPTGLVASVDRGDDVELTWSSPAERFRVYRCDGAPCSGAWVELTTEPVSERRFRDTSVTAPASPAAPVPKTENDHTYVEVSWDAVAAPEGPRYTYRVTALDEDAKESVPSSEVVGHRAERPVMRYEIAVDDGAWLEVGLVTAWTDLAAGAPTLSVGQVTASQGTFAAYVELVATGVSASPGPPRRYTVRAVTAYGPGPSSGPVEGRRAAPTVALQWQRSVDATADTFEDLASGGIVQDTSAPADGSARLYRVVASGDGAETIVSAAVTGWRQPPPGVPGGLSASTELSDRVKLSWQAVSEAIGYHVYRGEQKLTSGNGITATTFEDFDTAAPGEWVAVSGLTASTQRTDGIEVSWVAPSRPVGTTVSYSVSAVNASGEGPRSASVSGRRSAPALDAWEVEVGGTRTEVVSSVSWLDEDAPRAQIEAGTITATQGEHRAFVRLSHSGGAVTPATVVSYRVRGRLVGGGGTPWSEATEGRRAHGAVSVEWRRSAGTTAQGFTEVGLGQVFNDTTAPTDGARRWYQVVLSAPGAESIFATAVDGWRLAFVGIAAGHEFTCARTAVIPDGGRVWCWGANTSGQLGRGHVNNQPAPQRVPNLDDVVEVATGAESSHVCARKGDETVWCWGLNTSGQVGNGVVGGNRPVPTIVSDLAAQSLSVGGNTSCSRRQGPVHCWGANDFGQVGANVSGEQPSPVRVRTATRDLVVRRYSVGTLHVCATNATGSGNELWCWGNNDAYQLGAMVPTTSSVAIHTRDLETAAIIESGSDATCVRTSSAPVRCWGSNYQGLLGQSPDVVQSDEPLEIPNLVASEMSLGGGFGCAIPFGNGGSVRCWGSNNNGRLGDGSTTSNHIPQPVLLSPGTTLLTNATSISAGTAHACALVNNAPYCWGGAPVNSTKAVAVTLP